MNESQHSPDLSSVPWPTSERRAATSDTPAAPGGVPTAVDPPSHDAPGAHETQARLRETRDEWVEGVRASVRNNPLATVAAAVALGAVIARIAR